MRLTFELHSFRRYGEPKLAKPKELAGISSAFSVDYISGKCKCPVYIDGDDVWIKHRDYFSESMRVPPEDRGAPLEYLAKKYGGRDKRYKFNYPDSWGAIVLRNEAWIVIRGLGADVRLISPLKLLRGILRQQERLHGWETYTLDCSDMERMYERLIFKLRERS